ncbi:MAG: SUMF1/EgtB/PvdO family nonheme iron enzyme, partial [bacterium]
NPTGPSSGDERALRGGDWSNRGSGCRASGRGSGTPDSRHNIIGFRVARNP